ncbi:response regulator transcription factor [Mucilaginibacter sp. HC2]|uniref:response regulator transcription factor n=1 Tax=Mucilaginibacter inviolabilis TaxID=2714892 RepID=UPI0014082A3C|nr:response regulator transcription factor [Mucilaginibacter inviolabilis]NHA05818.1 response regulator transcription factor [Mucilaginibacter inviolabilis]
MKKIKVLYVEDEPFLAEIVSDDLRASGYEVLHKSNGQLAAAAFRKERPDICIFDIMLPLKDGYTLAKEIRELDSSVPIIFLSAKVQSENVVTGFKSGGNDYLRKPFSIDELLVRMESLLGRKINVKEAVQLDKQTLYEFGNCTLDTVNQILMTLTGRVTLSFKECSLLEMLILQKNEVLERETILMKIWGSDGYYNSRSLNVFLTHLRKLLQNEKEIKILNIRGIGYKLTLNAS